jgi:uracil-DNA glycosylase family 4
MDARMLRELELAEVATLYGLVETHAEKPKETRATGERRESKAPHAREPAREVKAEASSAPRAPAPPVQEAGWEELRAIVSECRACALCEKRKQAVFGVGHESAPWLFVGEGPGADEDEQGEPFVGQAGKLLDSMLAAIGCERGREVYIANVVKCRPPGNRTPTFDEAAACAPFLDRQIELIAPKVIVALGKTAATRLLGTEASLASLRGKVHRYKAIPVVVTYHPAYLLRSLPEKAKAWEDLLFARRTLAQVA